MRMLLRVGGALLIVLMRLLLRVRGACGPPPPFAAPLASSLRAHFRGDPPHDGPAAASCPIYRQDTGTPNALSSWQKQLLISASLVGNTAMARSAHHAGG